MLVGSVIPVVVGFRESAVHAVTFDNACAAVPPGAGILLQSALVFECGYELVLAVRAVWCCPPLDVRRVSRLAHHLADMLVYCRDVILVPDCRSGGQSVYRIADPLFPALVGAIMELGHIFGRSAHSLVPGGCFDHRTAKARLHKKCGLCGYDRVRGVWFFHISLYPARYISICHLICLNYDTIAQSIVSHSTHIKLHILIYEDAVIISMTAKPSQIGPRKYVFLQKPAPSKHTGYYDLAIIECDERHIPQTIKETRKGNARIMDARYNVYVGASDRSFGYRLAQRMESEIDGLNDREQSIREGEIWT